MITIDINAQTISNTTKVWRLFPGANYKFLSEFDRQKSAFLDLPGLLLPDAPLAKSEELLPRILASHKFAEEKRRSGPESKPKVNWKDFEKSRRTKARGRQRQAVINFFEEAAKGDLIVVPSSLSSAEVRIGEFISAPARRSSATFASRYGDAKIPARSIRWRRLISEHQLSNDLSKSLRNQHPFSLLERSSFLEVFSLAYDAYIYGEQHSSVVYNTTDDYTDRETALIGMISKLAASVCEEIERKNAVKGPLIERLIVPNNIEFSCAHSSDIHSKGFNRFTGAKITALVVVAVMAALIALSSVDTKAQLSKQVANITFVNSAAPPKDPCTANVSAASQKILNVFDIDQLWLVCQSMKESQARAGLEPGVIVTNDANPNKD